MKNQKLYFIAIIPPEPVHGDVLHWKHEFAEHYDSKAALRSPPHITLHMPFKWREDQEERIDQALKELVFTQQPFDVKLDGFGAFKPKTIFVQVMNNDSLNDLHEGIKRQMKQSLNIFNADYKDRPFHPHMTVAFRDLKKHRFTEAWEAFESRTYGAIFPVHAVTLLKHNGKFWEVHRSLEMASP
ncbi:MAG: RNA 2',3'-cyclic phosphodiesterase [Fulvivirga sp.]